MKPSYSVSKPRIPRFSKRQLELIKTLAEKYDVREKQIIELLECVGFTIVHKMEDSVNVTNKKGVKVVRCILIPLFGKFISRKKGLEDEIKNKKRINLATGKPIVPRRRFRRAKRTSTGGAGL